MSENAIVVEKVTKRFDSVTAVDDLSLEIKWGELFGLLGPNGAGKTTLINVLSTLLAPTEGGAQVGGFDVEHDGDTGVLLDDGPHDLRAAKAHLCPVLLE